MMNNTTWVDPAGRVCTRCKKYKLWQHFSLKRKKNPGPNENPFKSWCKACVNSHSNTARGGKSDDGFIEKNGYKVITVNGKQIYKQRYIMEIILGRELYLWENVHHKNGIRTDNHYENLELWCVSQPKGQRVVDLVDWVITNYPDTVKERLNG